MSRHWSHFKEFKCANDCQQTGCPGHKMRIVYVCTSDHVIVEIDPDEAARPGSAEWNHLFDDNAFDAMVDLEIERREKWAKEQAEREELRRAKETK